MIVGLGGDIAFYRGLLVQQISNLFAPRYHCIIIKLLCSYDKLFIQHTLFSFTASFHFVLWHTYCTHFLVSIMWEGATFIELKYLNRKRKCCETSLVWQSWVVVRQSYPAMTSSTCYRQPALHDRRSSRGIADSWSVKISKLFVDIFKIYLSSKSRYDKIRCNVMVLSYFSRQRLARVNQLLRSI